MSELPPIKKQKMDASSNFRLLKAEKERERLLRDAGFDISLMYRNALNSAYCAFVGQGNDWDENGQ